MTHATTDLPGTLSAAGLKPNRVPPMQAPAPKQPAAPPPAPKVAHDTAHHSALRTTLVYVLGATTWILLSDLLLLDAGPAALPPVLHPLKGLAFVLLTGALLYAFLRRQWQQLITAKENAEESDRLKSALLANMSHEIRTPLTGILGFAELIATDPEADRCEIAGRIYEAGQRLMRTLNAVLDLAQLTAGKRTLRLESVDLSRDSASIAAMWGSRAQAHGLTFDYDCRLDGPALLDRSAVDRILDNLLSNAVKFTEQGSVALRIAVAGDELVLEVEDTGKGIDPAFLPHLFEAFRQESNGMGRQHEGSGLGLSLTWRLVNLLGGEIGVRSRKGAGTCFTVRLPYRPAPAAAATPPTGLTGSGSP